MMPAAKHFDPVVGIDIHIIQPPGPVPPVPVPHPFIGIIMDPMDYIPIVGATVKINGLPRGLAGTQGIATPPHIPIGGVFVKPPANECEIFMGVATINCDGDALSHFGLPVLSCHCIGMPPIPRPRKKGAVKSMVLPTSTVMSIPAGPPVLVAGPPTISLMALAMRIGMSALGKAFKKFKKTKAGKKLAKKLNKVKSKFKKKPSSPNKSCGRAGEPIDVVTGANVDVFIDWSHPAYPHLMWQRFYSSNFASEASAMGGGFRHSFQHELTETAEGFTYRDCEGDVVEFPPIDPKLGSTTNDGLVIERIDGVYKLSGSLHKTIWFGNENRNRFLPIRIEQSGRLVSFDYDHYGNVTKILDENNAQLQIAYDGRGQLAAVAFQAGQDRTVISSYSYDDRGLLTEWTDAIDGRASYQYNAKSLMIRKEDRNGYAYHYEYDELDRCTHSWGDDGLYDIRLEYFAEEQLTIVQWADGATYEYYYDDEGVLAKIIDPAGGVRVFEQDDNGNIVSEIEPNGDEVQYLYDNDGAHIGRIDASGQVLLPMHLQPHRPDGLAYELPNTPATWTLGRLAAEEACHANVVDAEIQAVPAAVRQSLPTLKPFVPISAHQKHDILGRVVEQTDARGLPQQLAYDKNGNIIRDRDADGAFWSYFYKSWNLVDEARDPNGFATKYDYNLREAITRVIDAGGTSTEYEYDNCDRIVSVTRAGQLRDRYGYDNGGALIEKFDSSGNRLLQLEPGPYDTHAKIECASGEVFKYKHTKRARIQEVEGPNHKVAFDYDLFDQVRLDARNGKGIEYKWTSPQTLALSVLGKLKVLYERQENGSIRIVDPTGKKTTVHADGKGRFIRRSEDGFSEVVTYDQRGLCTSKIASLPSQKTLGRVHRYSTAGNLIQTADSELGRIDYQYDPAHRLTARIRGGAREVYQHDPANNLIQKPGLVNVKVGSGNQITEACDEKFTHNERCHISVRARIDGRTHRYTYNSLDQLVKIEGEDGFTWSAQYDGLNRRISKEWTEGFDKHKIEYYWDHRRLAAEVIDEKRLRVYVYGDRDSFVPLMMIEYGDVNDPAASGVRYHLISDQRGQITEAIDESGKVAWKMESQPYGEGRILVRDIEFNLRLAGQYADDEVGLYYNRYRYFDPSIGDTFSLTHWD